MHGQAPFVLSRWPNFKPILHSKWLQKEGYIQLQSSTASWCCMFSMCCSMDLQNRYSVSTLKNPFFWNYEYLNHNLNLGNTWGICANGTGAIGCGDQEMFRNCADIKIISNVGRPPNVVLPKVSIPNALYVPGDLTKKVSTPFVVRSQVCVPVAAQRNNTGMSEWCKENCLKYPPNCDPDRCECL